MSVSTEPLAGSEAATAILGWRGLGGPGDLDLDFSRLACLPPRRAETTSAVLFQCTEAGTPQEAQEAVWRMTLTARIAGLIAIWLAGSGRNALEVEPLCTKQSCGERMELSLPVNDLLAMAEEARTEPERCVELASGRVTIRRPTGADQRAWRKLSPNSLAEAALVIAHSLVVEGEVSAADRAALSEALAEFDPLPCFMVETVCPHCAAPLTLPVDLEGVLLDQLGQQQAALLTEVHHFAKFYGWHEAEVLAIPAWRRQRYLALSQEPRDWA